MPFFRKFFQSNKVPEKKITKTDDKKSSSSLLVNLPLDTKGTIANFFGHKELATFAGVNKEFYHQAKSENSEEPRFYYAVGNSIDLYRYRFTRFGDYSEKRKVSKKRMEQSLNYSVKLFSDFETARQFARLSSINELDRGMDLFVPIEAPGIFVVKVLQNNPYHIKKINVTATQHIPECPAPPRPEEMKAAALQTKKSNTHIYFSRLSGGVRNHHKAEGQFSEIWQEAVLNKSSLQEIALAGINAVFRSYFTWYSVFTRHNQALVHDILHDLRQNPSIEEMNRFLTACYEDAMRAHDMNKNGHYVQMLKFSLAQLKPLCEINDMPGINDYMGLRR